MEIITLLKAGIRRKKGTFIGVVLLTAIVVSMIASMNSVQDNYYKGIDNAMTELDAGDVQSFVRSESLTNEIKNKIEGSNLVSKVEYINAIGAGGATVGDETTNNSHFLLKMRDGIKLFNDVADGFVNDIPKLKEGEIYLPYGLNQVLVCKVGDKISYDVMDKKYTFTIKGFVQEPTQGATNIGWKQVFISDADYDRIYNETKHLETQDGFMDITCVIIHKAEDSELSIAKFQRQLNLETKIITIASGTLNKEQSIHYTTLMTDVVMGIVQAFVVCLLAVMLVVMGHSISTEIEIDYVDLGVLKAQGFTKEKIRLVMGLQYLLAELAGALIGVAVSVPLERAISDLCMEITGILPVAGFSTVKAVACVLIILVVSGMLIMIKTRKIASISPVRAISGGRDTIYWGSRIQMPIMSKLLSASVAIRQFTSDKKRYIATLFIIAILTFCMITVNLTGNLLSSRDAQEAMGIMSVDIALEYEEGMTTGCFDEAEAVIEEYSDIVGKSDTYRCYASINGENYMCETYSEPSVMTRALRGREIRYDNEVLITEMVADALEVGIGDEVTVAYGEGEATFIVAGFYQSGYDTGMSFTLSFDGAQRLGIKTQYGYRAIFLKDQSKLTEIENAVNERCDSRLKIECYSVEESMGYDAYGMIVELLKGIIYTFSVIFSFVVVMMVCNKAFIQERRDIGIYKSMGFTSSKLRLSFGIRFGIVAFLGSVAGVILSVFFSAKLLGMMLSVVGLSMVVTEYTLDAVLVPILVVSASFFVFAYLTSGKIKKVSVRELTVE